MANARGAEEARFVQPSIFGREVLAGLNSLPLLFPLATAAGVIAYAPLGPDYAGRGAVAGMLCAAVGGLIASIVRSSSGLVMTTTTSFVSIQASLLGTIVVALGPVNELHLAALPVLVLLTGLLMVLFGAIGAARVVKFVPFPVVSGFTSGVGTLLLLKFGPAILGVSSPHELWEVASGHRWPNAAIAIFTVMMLAIAFFFRRAVPRAPGILLTLLAGIAVYELANIYGHAYALGPVVGAGALSALWTSPVSGARWLADADFTALWANRQACFAIALSAATLAVISVLDTVLATRGVQNIVDFPASPRRDMVGLGTANLASALIGGVGLSTSTPQSAANYRAGGYTRLSAVVLSASLLMAVLVFPRVIALVPLCVFPPLIVFIGWWMIDPYTRSILQRSFVPDRVARSQARRNALIHFSVLVPTALNQPLIGVGIGVVLSSIVFIVSMSRPIVRRERDAKTLTSKRVWTRTESEALAKHGAAIVTFDLDGPLFFGNAEELAEAIKAKEQARIVILNLWDVSDIDATGLRIMEKIKSSLAATGRRLIIAAVPQAIAGTVEEFRCDHCFRDIDDALECAETMLIRQQSSAGAAEINGEGDKAIELSDFDLCQRASPEQVGILASRLQRECHPAGAKLCQEGDIADRIWMIRSGAVSVRIGKGADERRIAAFGPGTIVGEMAIVENELRSASVVVDEAVDTYVLTRDAYRGIMSNNPDLGLVLLNNISRALSRRLRATSADLHIART